jgi:catalase
VEAVQKLVQPGKIACRLPARRVVDKNDNEGLLIIFDPIPRVTGIEPSANPLFEPRADVYVMSGKRRPLHHGL